jgi:Beta-lactamase enzyme family/ORF 12 gene product N-terminal
LLVKEDIMAGQGIRRHRLRGRAAHLRLAVPLAAVTLLATACTSSAGLARVGETSAAPPARPAQTVTPPGTPAGAQLRWLMAELARLPLSDAQVRAHFDAAFLTQFNPAALNQMLEAAIRIDLVSIQVSQPSTLVANVLAGGGERAQVWLDVDSHGLISWLRISPASTGPTPATWAGVDSALRAVAPRVRLLVAKVGNGSCQPIHSIDPGTAAPLGSAFKLYVLDALGDAVAAGKVRWGQALTVTAQVKGLPPGELQTEPDGTQVSVLDAAGKMISLSDNTAADMLIGLLGRPAIEASLTTTGMASPAMNLPFLTTREIYVLKLRQWPVLASRFIAADESGRRALLASTVDRAPLPTLAEVGAWTAPRDIDSLEYFGSASDICRAYASLADLDRQPGLAPIGQVLAVNDDGLQLDPAQWKTTWFKGGSEPGALSLAYLATTRAGQSYVVTVLAENPSQPLGDDAIPAILSAVKGAFTLATRG